MKFLVDAQLPRRLVGRLHEAGHDAVHTLDLPTGNRTPDAEIIAIANADGRIVVTKDGDFANSFVVSHQPEKPFFISTGNISNDELEALLLPNLGIITTALDVFDFVELTRTLLIIHIAHG